MTTFGSAFIGERYKTLKLLGTKALKCFVREGEGTSINQMSNVLELLVYAEYLPIAQGHWTSSGLPEKRLENSRIVP